MTAIQTALWSREIQGIDFQAIRVILVLEAVVVVDSSLDFPYEDHSQWKEFQGNYYREVKQGCHNDANSSDKGYK